MQGRDTPEEDDVAMELDDNGWNQSNYLTQEIDCSFLVSQIGKNAL